MCVGGVKGVCLGRGVVLGGERRLCKGVGDDRSARQQDRTFGPQSWRRPSDARNGGGVDGDCEARDGASRQAAQGASFERSWASLDMSENCTSEDFWVGERGGMEVDQYVGSHLLKAWYL